MYLWGVQGWWKGREKRVRWRRKGNCCICVERVAGVVVGNGLLLEKGEAVHEGWVEGCSLGRDARWGREVHI